VDPKLVGELVRIIWPNLQAVLLEQATTFGDGGHESLGRLTRSDTRDDISDHVVPRALGHGSVDSRVSHDHDATLEERDKDQDPGPITSRKDLLIEKAPLCTLPGSQIESTVADEPPAKVIGPPGSQGPGHGADEEW